MERDVPIWYIEEGNDNMSFPPKKIAKKILCYAIIEIACEQIFGL